MAKNPRRARKGPAAWLGNSTREVIAAWLVLFPIVAAGLSFFAVHRFDVADCTPMLVMPGAHHRPAADREWVEDPVCAVGSCDNAVSMREIDPEGSRAAQNGGDGATAVYSGSSSAQGSPHGDGADEGERLC